MTIDEAAYRAAADVLEREGLKALAGDMRLCGAQLKAASSIVARYTDGPPASMLKLIEARDFDEIRRWNDEIIVGTACPLYSGCKTSKETSHGRV